MEVQFASLSIHKFVNSVGADAGFAAFIGIALLAILYFAQARESASLRDRLDEAHDRIAGLEARIGQLIHLQSTRQPAAPGPTRAPAPVTPAPASVRPMGSAIASVRRVPAATPGAAATAGVGAGPRLAAPVGLGAPALASATKLIPDPVVSDGPGLAPDDTMLVPPATAASGNGHTEAHTAVRPPATTPPRVQIRPAGAAAAGAGTAGAAAAAGAAPGRAGAGSPPQVRRIGGTASAPGAANPRARGEQRFEAFEPERSRRFGSRGRRLPAAIVLVALIAIVVGAVVITQNSGSGTSTGLVHKTGTTGSNGTSTSATKGKKHPKAPPFKASSVTVAVLNSTGVGGLAADVGTALANQGYKKGSITNGATQTQSTTIVYYRPGAKVAAQHVADALKLGLSSVKPASQSALQSCATTPTGAASSCAGNVIVSVGSDRASLASSSGSSSAG